MTTGLRERKRAAAMRRIQSIALDMFEARGFDEVTIEEIADASDVSPSSVYRYFGTKEALVLWHEHDPLLGGDAERAVSAEVPLIGLREAVLAALASGGEEGVVRRQRLIAQSPALDEAAVAQAHAQSKLLETVLARQLGRPVEDLQVQVFAHAFTGGFLGMYHHWAATGFREPLRDVVERVFEIFFEGLDIVVADEPAGIEPRDAKPLPGDGRAPAHNGESGRARGEGPA